MRPTKDTSKPNSLSFKKAFRAFSYATSRNYLTWALVSALFFVPLTMIVLMFNATAEGFRAAANYLNERDFKIGFTYATYVMAKARIEKAAKR